MSSGSGATDRWGGFVRWATLATCLAVIAPAGGGTASASGVPGDDRLNVIIISLDTVRPDHLSCYGYDRRTSPNLDRLAERATLFTHAFSQAAETMASHLSIFTSRYPTKAWLEWTDEFNESAGNLTEILKQHGYVTAAFTGFDEGFDLFKPLLSSAPFTAFDHVAQGEWLRRPSDDLFRWFFVNRHRPFYLFLHGYDAHEPHVVTIGYDPNRFDRGYSGGLPGTYLDLITAAGLSAAEMTQLPLKSWWWITHAAYRQHVDALGGMKPVDLEHMQAVYDAQIYYMDQGVGEVLTALEHLGLMDRTLLVVLSDHGQEFGEHGYYALHSQCYDEVIQIVLLVRDPRRSAGKGRKVHQLVRGVDVMPTILDLLGLPAPEAVVGRSLVPLLDGRRDPGREDVAVSACRWIRTIRTPEWRLISLAGDAAELYRISRDPRQQRNVIQRYPAIARELARRLDALMPFEHVPFAKPKDPVAWIKEHGYW